MAVITSSVANISFVVTKITFKVTVITSSVGKVTYVVAEITFKDAAITSLVAKVTFLVAKITFKVYISYLTGIKYYLSPLNPL